MKPHPRYVIILALFLILAAAVFCRFAVITHHLPPLPHIEEKEVAFAATALAEGKSPGSFTYPSLLYYIFIPIVRVDAMLSALTGWAPQESVILAGRYFSLAAGLVLLVLVFQIGRRLFSAGAGLLASAFLAMDQLHTFFSVTAKPDMLMAVLAMSSAIVSCRVFTTAPPCAKEYIFAGVLAGLAAAAKYNGVLVISALFAAHFLGPARGVRGGMVRLSAALFAAAGVFLALNPYIFADWTAFTRDFGGELARAGEGFARNAASTRGWLNYPRGFLAVMGFPLVVCAICGVAVGIMRRRKETLMVLSFPVAYYLVMGYSNNSPAHYLFPIIPFMLLPAADLIMKLKKTRPLLAFLLVVCVAALPAWRLAQFIRWIGQEDTRLAARAWIERNTLPGASVLIDGVDDAIPFIFGKERVPLRLRVIRWEPESARGALADGPYDLVVTMDMERPERMRGIYASIADSYYLVRKFTPRVRCPEGPFRGNSLYHPIIRIYMRKTTEAGG